MKKILVLLTMALAAMATAQEKKPDPRAPKTELGPGSVPDSVTKDAPKPETTTKSDDKTFVGALWKDANGKYWWGEAPCLSQLREALYLNHYANGDPSKTLDRKTAAEQSYIEAMGCRNLGIAYNVSEPVKDAKKEAPK